MTRSLRNMLSTGELVRAPGVWNGLSARLAEDAGFPVVFGSGLAISASMGLPDSDIYSKGDVLRAMGEVCAATSVPVVADGDTGFGTAVNVAHFVRDLERIGVTAVTLEDQQSPKRCPSLPGKPLALVSIEEAAGKIRAAVSARRTDEFLVIARSDAATPEEMMRRAEAYAEAGADLIFPNAVTRDQLPLEEWAKVHANTGLPLLACPVPGGWIEQEMSREVMLEIGVRLEWLAVSPLYAEMHAVRGIMQSLQRENRLSEVEHPAFEYADLTEIVRYSEVSRMQSEFIPQS